MLKQIHRSISFLILTAFFVTSIKTPAFAQTAEDPLPYMSKPGIMVHLSSEFTPAYLKGIVIHPENALKFDFIIYKGDTILNDAQKKEEYTKLTKYFLASLAIPDDDQWVNLSPYEKDRIIKDDFGKTEMGRDLLAQDYMLKQITASLIYPEDSLGKKFWDKVYSEAQKQYGTSNIPVNTFNKVWILPDDALIYEKDNTAYVLRNHLKVMLEEDYLSLKKHAGITSVPSSGVIASEAKQSLSSINALGSKIVKEIVLPELEREVNEDKNFAAVRQVYSGMLLAAWYKRALKESLLSKIYADKSKVKGVDQPACRQAGTPCVDNEVIYRQYLKAYKKGVFNFIKEDVDKYTNEIIPRKYFSGGTRSYVDFAQTVHRVNALDPEQAQAVVADEGNLDLAQVDADESLPGAADQAMAAVDHGLIWSTAAGKEITIKDRKGRTKSFSFSRPTGNGLYMVSIGSEHKSFASTDTLIGPGDTRFKVTITTDGERVLIVNVRPSIPFDVIPSDAAMTERKIHDRLGEKHFILFVEEDSISRQRMGAFLKGYPNLSVHFVSNLAQARQALLEEGGRVGLVIEAEAYPDEDGGALDQTAGSKLIDDIKRQNLKIPVILTTLERTLTQVRSPNAMLYYRYSLEEDLIHIFNGLGLTANAAMTSNSDAVREVVERAQNAVKVVLEDRQASKLIVKDVRDVIRNNFKGEGTDISPLAGELENYFLTKFGISVFGHKVDNTQAGLQVKDGVVTWLGVKIANPTDKGYEVIDANMPLFVNKVKELIEQRFGPVGTGVITANGKGIQELVKNAESAVEQLNDQKEKERTAQGLGNAFRKHFEGEGINISLLVAELENYFLRTFGVGVFGIDITNTQTDLKVNDGVVTWLGINIAEHTDKGYELIDANMPSFVDKVRGHIEQRFGLNRVKKVEAEGVSQGVSQELSGGQGVFEEIKAVLHITDPGGVVRNMGDLQRDVNNFRDNEGKLDHIKKMLIDPRNRGVFELAIKQNAPIQDKAQVINPGGIDFNSANLNLQIKRDGRGVPLPISQQDLEHINIDGLIPVIIEIKPAASLPIFAELQNTVKV